MASIRKVYHGVFLEPEGAPEDPKDWASMPRRWKFENCIRPDGTPYWDFQKVKHQS